MSFKNLSIIVKIVSLLTLLGILASAAAIYSGMKMREINDSYVGLMTHGDRAVTYIARANRYISELKVGIMANTMAEDEAGNKIALAKQKDAFNNATKFFADSAKLVPAHADEIGGMSEAVTKAYTQSCAETLRLANDESDKDGNAKSQKLMNDVCAPALDKISGGMVSLVGKLTADSDKAIESLVSTTDTTVLLSYVLVFGGLAVVMVISIFAAMAGISSPIKALNKTMGAMAGGNLALTVAGTERKDEIGQMSRTVEEFRLALAETERLREQAHATEVENAEKMKHARNQIADQFQAKMGALADAFARSSSEVSDSAKNLSATAEETARQAQAVSGAAEEASANVQTVAASTEEMSASIREIASQVSKSTDVANMAATEAARTETDVQALSEAAAKIGEVVELINNIAGQTNLLALNATIEAARAGEAGRGFAVVASEVKQLAAQTARATEEISSKINEIQSATNRTVESIDKIVGTVAQIQQISTMIATAIEEQGAATSEISSNTQLAARGTEDVTNNINGVGRAAEMTGTASTQLMGLSGSLNTQASDLQREVVDFVKQLRAG
jgi:methyl-accepting chemotaxis protein